MALAIPPGINKGRFLPGSLIGVLLFHLLALAAPFTFTWAGFVAFLIMSYVTLGLGLTLGYHRLLTHTGFQTTKPIKYLLTFFGCLAMEGGPIRWVATHRLHHKETDTAQDPHSPIQGFLWSHLLWNFYRHPAVDTQTDLRRLAPDIERDSVLRFLDKHFFTMYLLVALLFFVAGTLLQGWQMGLSLVIWGCALRTVYVWHCTWLVNSATHLWGYQRFQTPNNSRNNWWVALLTYGEGWHNNHHAHPQSAKMGFTWYELDMTYWVLWSLQKLGLAQKVLLPDLERNAPIKPFSNAAH